MGGHLIQHVEKEFEVIATFLSHPFEMGGCKCIYMDITDRDNTQKAIIKERPDLVIHVVDAKNLERMLPLTLQLIEASLSTILVLNMMDEAKGNGVEVDLELLEKELGIPVVGTVSTTGEGMDVLKKRIESYER